MTLALEAISAALAGREVLRDVSLALAPGEVLGVIGPNGAGKSTLLRVAAGLLRPSAGTATLDGRALEDWERQQLARRIAFLPQNRTVHWPLDARAVVALGRLPYLGFAGAESAADKAAIDTAMAQADVAGLATRSVSALSGGELARVLLARALAQDAPILIADEPAAGLDPAHQLDLFQRFRTLAGRQRSIIVALHDLSAAARFCDRLLLLANGQVLALGAASDVLSADRLGAAYGIAARMSQIEGVPIVVPLHRLT